MVDVIIIKSENSFKLKISKTSKMGYDLVKNKIHELQFVSHITNTSTFNFDFNQLANVMEHLDNQNIIYQFVYQSITQQQNEKHKDGDSDHTPKKSYRKKEFIDGRFKPVYKTVEIREHKDGYYWLEMEWHNEINDFLKTIDEESRYFDSDLKVWKITKPYLNDFVKAVDRAGLKYEIHYRA